MESISFDKTGCFNQFFLDYVNRKENLKPFISDFFSKESLKNPFLDFKYREELYSSLQNQYKEVGLEPPEQLSALLDNSTHTITTGHQLCLFTGPLYFHYKIMSTIKLAKEASTNDRKVLPVFWMATEDHDFEEINHFHDLDKTYRWDTNQSGAVGEFSLDDMGDFLDSIPSDYDWMKVFYKKSKTLSEATRKIVHHLYGDKGLIIIDANRPELKRIFLSQMKNELSFQVSFNEVSKTNNEILKNQYKVQVNPREINLFYKHNGVRERIIKIEGNYQVNNTNLKWKEKEFFDIIEEQPDLVSPNVILRPVYQQTILPNIAYIGGPGELIYWLQLKSTHDKFQVPFPLLVPRDHILYLDKVDLNKKEKLSLSNQDLFASSNQIKKVIVEKSDNQIDIESFEFQSQLILNNLQKEVVDLDFSLHQFMEAEKKRIEKEFNRIRKKVNRAVELKENIQLSRISDLMSKLRPSGSLQERRLNFLTYYKLNTHFLDEIYLHIDPTNLSFKIVSCEKN